MKTNRYYHVIIKNNWLYYTSQIGGGATENLFKTSKMDFRVVLFESFEDAYNEVVKLIGINELNHYNYKIIKKYVLKPVK